MFCYEKEGGVSQPQSQPSHSIHCTAAAPIGIAGCGFCPVGREGRMAQPPGTSGTIADHCILSCSDGFGLDLWWDQQILWLLWSLYNPEHHGAGEYLFWGPSLYSPNSIYCNSPYKGNRRKGCRTTLYI